MCTELFVLKAELFLNPEKSSSLDISTHNISEKLLLVSLYSSVKKSPNQQTGLLYFFVYHTAGVSQKSKKEFHELIQNNHLRDKKSSHKIQSATKLSISSFLWGHSASPNSNNVFLNQTCLDNVYVRNSKEIIHCNNTLSSLAGLGSATSKSPVNQTSLVRSLNKVPRPVCQIQPRVPATAVI